MYELSAREQQPNPKRDENVTIQTKPFIYTLQRIQQSKNSKHAEHMNIRKLRKLTKIRKRGTSENLENPKVRNFRKLRTSEHPKPEKSGDSEGNVMHNTRDDDNLARLVLLVC
jgi:hypothetical protein